MSVSVDPTPSRRDERRRRARRKTLIRVGIAAGSVLVLVAVAAFVWVGFAPPAGPGHLTALTSKTPRPLVTVTSTPTATPTKLTREQMALTPPMGWNSWNAVGCPGLSAQVVENAADAIVADGLKFGIYAVPGSQTCANYFSRYPIHGIGSIGHEQQDANTFASWGVDYLKYDWCRADINDHLVEQPTFSKMEKDLDATGRNIMLSISEYGVKKPWLWAPGIANLWRTTHDIHPNWPSVFQHINLQVPVTKYAKPGAWNDPDMLEIGDGGLTPTEDTTHFAMWCMFAAPLFLGTDISKLPAASVSLVTNPELIAIDQDPLGHEAHLVTSVNGIEYWMRPLSGGRYAVALFNTTGYTKSVSATFANLGISAGNYTIRDVVNHANMGSSTSGVTGSAPTHGIVVLELTPVS